MEINYELILKYLTNKQSDKIPIFSTKKNSNNNNFPDKFKNVIGSNFFRYGITIYDKENLNISFWTSLLTILNKNNFKLYIENEFELINKLKNDLINEYNLSSLSYLLKDISKNNIRERFQLSPDEIVLQYIVDILDINIIIFDFKNENINVLYTSNIMNPWKQILLFANYDNYWEPIFLDKLNSSNPKENNIDYTFNYNTLAIKNLLMNTSITYYKFNKTFSYINNMNDIIKIENNKTEPITIQINNTITDNIIDINNLNKLKRDELVEILTKYNIIITSKKLTKTQLISMIVEKTNPIVIKEDTNKTKLNKMTKDELIEMCKTNKININSKMIKKELIDIIITQINLD